MKKDYSVETKEKINCKESETIIEKNQNKKNKEFEIPESVINECLSTLE